MERLFDMRIDVNLVPIGEAAKWRELRPNIPLLRCARIGASADYQTSGDDVP